MKIMQKDGAVLHLSYYFKKTETPNKFKVVALISKKIKVLKKQLNNPRGLKNE